MMLRRCMGKAPQLTERNRSKKENCHICEKQMEKFEKSSFNSFIQLLTASKRRKSSPYFYVVLYLFIYFYSINFWRLTFMVTTKCHCLGKSCLKHKKIQI